MRALRNILAAWLCLAVLAPLASGQDKDKKAEKGEKKEATVKVLVPDEDDLTLSVDGEEYAGKGETREFRTPPLEPGKKFFYVVKAKWMPSNYETFTRTRKVIVEAGKTITVDMRKADPKQPDDIFIRYVPTPQVVVDKMMEMGKVGKDDVVYDLGCGDGRLVVTAVSKFNAKKGVGVDLDPDRIKESNDNAKKADVVEKVEFRKGDVMKLTDLDKASVVTMYLADSLCDQLRPILLRQLKVGSRIVSHRFLMGPWKPDKTETVMVGTTPYKLHIWTVKAEDKEKYGDKPKDDKPKDGDKPKDDKPKDGDKKDKEKDGGKGSPVSAEEVKWLDEMLVAEKDARKKKEIEEEFRAESRVGRSAMYKLFQKVKKEG